MENEIVRIPAEEFCYAANEDYSPIQYVDWHGLKIAVKRHMSLKEVAKFVDVCTKACFNSDDGQYTPEAKDMAVRSCILAFYTNIDLPDSIEDQYEAIYHSMILDEVMPNIDSEQFKAVLRAIDEKVSHLAEGNISFLNERINDACNIIDGIQDKMSTLFGDVSADELKGVITALSSGTIDEEKIIEEYFKHRQ